MPKTKPRVVDDTPSATESPRSLGYRMPAEWEPHAATWLAFPHEASDWPGKFEVVPWVFAEIAKKLAEGERVRLIVRDAAMKKRAKAVFEQTGVDLAQVDFLLAPTDRSWTRGQRRLLASARLVLSGIRRRGVRDLRQDKRK